MPSPRWLVALGAVLALAWLAAARIAPAVRADPPRRSDTAAGGPAEVLEGVVVRVVDGDTLTLRVGGGEHAIRLAQIDAPERDQPYARRSTEALSELALGRPARVEVVDVDDYDRLVGEVYVAGVHVNREMVRRGHAWAYTRYARSPAILEDEDAARAAARGLWSLPLDQRTAPWEWRHGARHRRPAPAASAVCAERLRCGEMKSCAEAKRRLAECGPSGIDGDGDGIPCESLCND